MKIEIQPGSGFCFGVTRAVEAIEKNLQATGTLNCLGQVVHNPVEIKRLEDLGMVQLNHSEIENMKGGGDLLVRAHGEPPETFAIAAKKGINVIDATCSVVKKLQFRIKKVYEEHPDRQILIYGNPGHPELIGLAGQTHNSAILVDDKHNGLERVDFSKPLILFSQTTQSIEGFNELVSIIKTRVIENGHNPDKLFVYHDTICRQVSQRGPGIKDFARKHDLMVFVGGKNSSNGKYLFNLCKSINPNSYFIESPAELDRLWFANVSSVGVSGATSTPLWQLQDAVEAIQKLTIDNEKPTRQKQRR